MGPIFAGRMRWSYQIRRWAMWSVLSDPLELQSDITRAKLAGKCGALRRHGWDIDIPKGTCILARALLYKSPYLRGWVIADHCPI